MMLDKDFLLEELRARIKFLREEATWIPNPSDYHMREVNYLICRGGWNELERLVRLIETGTYDVEENE